MPKRQNNLRAFLFSRTFLFNILGAIAFYVGCVLLFAVFVRSYTKHGQSVTVPDVRGMTYDEAVKALSKSDLDVKISDSSYNDKQPAFAVLEQSPAPNSKVKEYRTVYLTVNAKSAPEMKMPDLKDASLKEATMNLESYGLRLGKLIYKPDLAENVVLDQQFEGQSIAPGATVKKGSVIDLILGDGLGQTEVEVPNLVGLSLREARFVLEGSSLNLGAVVADNSVTEDSLDAIVYQQIPAARDSSTKVNQGGGIDVFITSSDHYNKSPDQ